ncbi:MAG: rsfS [Bryobacterales bacterium]|nr:rsfS [Bryobacterales bacterium]
MQVLGKKQDIVLDPTHEALPEPVSTVTENHTEEDSNYTESPEIPGWLVVVRAAEEKKATDIVVLDLREVTTFTDYFVICTAGNAKQMQAITDDAALQMKRHGEPVQSIEGYEGGEWILSDYSDILLHCFHEKSREFYSLERLWKEAKRVEIPPAPAPDTAVTA